MQLLHQLRTEGRITASQGHKQRPKQEDGNGGGEHQQRPEQADHHQVTGTVQRLVRLRFHHFCVSPGVQLGFGILLVKKLDFTVHWLILRQRHGKVHLAGHNSGPVLDQQVWLAADSYTPADATSIPTGEILPVAGTPMDFRKMKPLGRDIEADFEALKLGHGYDHNWVLNHEAGVLGI